MNKRVKDNGLLLVNLVLFAIFLTGMTVTGWQVSNEEAFEHDGSMQSLGRYLLSGDFLEALSENWESEFLQMGAYVVMTVFLFQKGSSESKPVDKPAVQDEDPRRHSTDPHAPWPVRHGGFILVLYENSLMLLFVLLFVSSILVHCVSGSIAYSKEQQLHGLPGVTPIEYVATSQFWFESFQNWQSEFLVVAVLVLASTWLRQRGSAQSKPVAAAHDETLG
ncbi:hypothetical protein BH09ACT3_BH09ACT3_07360 [soil metagenome]